MSAQITTMFRRIFNFFLRLGVFVALLFLAIALVGNDHVYMYTDALFAKDVPSKKTSPVAVRAQDIPAPTFQGTVFWCDAYAADGTCLKHKPIKVAVKPDPTPTPRPVPTPTAPPIRYWYPQYIAFPDPVRVTPTPVVQPTSTPTSVTPQPTVEPVVTSTPQPAVTPSATPEPTIAPTATPAPPSTPTPEPTRPLVPQSLIAWPNSNVRLDFLPGFSLYDSVYHGYYENLAGAAIMPQPSMIGAKPNNLIVHQGLVNQYAPKFNEERYDAKSHFWKFYDFFRRKHPNILIGSYHSANDCTNESITAYPEPIFPCQEFPQDVKIDVGLSNRYRLNVGDAETFLKLAGTIVDRGIERSLPFMFLDNLAYRYGTIAERGYTWEKTLEFLGHIRTRLHQAGIRLAVNIAAPVVANMAQNGYADANAFKAVVDGMSFEQPFHPTETRPNLPKVLDEIGVYRRFLDDDKLVLLYGALEDTQAARLGELRYLAAMSMLIRQPGDSLFVTRWTFLNPMQYFDWLVWPTEFGAPKDGYLATERANDWVIERQFEKGSITVHQVTAKSNQPVFFTLTKGNHTNFKLMDGPHHGKIDVSNFPIIAYSPDWNYYFKKKKGPDTFTIGLNFDGKRYRDLIVVGITNQEDN